MEILAVLAVFALVTGLIVVPYYMFVVRDEQKVLDRLKPKTAASRVLKGVLRQEEKMSSVEPFDAALRRAAKVTGPVQRMIDQAGVRLNVGTFLLLVIVAPMAGFAAGTYFSGYALAGLVGALVMAPLPFVYLRVMRTRRMRKFEEQFPEAIDLVARALRAGHALPTGLGMVADELPAPVGLEFRKLYDEQNFGLTLSDALRNFAARIPVLDARFFVTAVLTQREAGGNLAEVLDNLSTVIRERFKVKRQVRVISAHGRITGWVLVGLPPSVAVITMFLSPLHVQTLLGDPLGIRMIITAGVMQVLGAIIISKIVNIEY
ncbi:MAG TPA: type II secretion system F family protein [Vicinamibacterales bacterium]|nr:type II secretion system F family protein [Vicinamibacterales bacterium]